ncbi:MAG: tetraacyldisaccharide 4'-kinase [Pseudomonadota bacterium]
MRAPNFWWEPGSLAATLLSPAAAAYGAIAGSRLRRAPSYTASVPVLCVGNFVVGGAGKTPVALAIADCLKTLDRKPAFLSRGYGGRLTGPIRVDPTIHDARQVGDEPLLLARCAPTMVARDRVAGAQALEASSTGAFAMDCIILDDGFQNPSLKKSLSLVVVDGATGVGNGKCIPAGPLRAPIEEQFARADCVVVLGKGSGQTSMSALCARAAIPVFKARLVPEVSEALAERPVIAHSGIGRPEKFFQTLEEAGVRIAERVPFPDHHEVTEAEAECLLRKADMLDAALVTTEKDHVRTPRDAGTAQVRLAERSEIVGVKCRFEDALSITDRLSRALRV